MGEAFNHSNPDSPIATHPGVADVNREGVAIAFEMLCELESPEIVDAESSVTTNDLSQLENWVRQGRPFRNVVHEYLARAREGGAAVEAGFCAVLSDLVSQVSAGSIPSAENYESMFDLGSDDEEVPNA
jgi:hypothetical protein